MTTGRRNKGDPYTFWCMTSENIRHETAFNEILSINCFEKRLQDNLKEDLNDKNPSCFAGLASFNQKSHFFDRLQPKINR